MKLHETVGENFTVWLAAKSAQGLVMPCHDDRAPIITHEEAVTLALLTDVMHAMRQGGAL